MGNNHLRQKELKKKHRLFLRKLIAILFVHDPMVINYGFNKDEYSGEAVAILTELETIDSEDKIFDIVLKVFSNSRPVNIARQKFSHRALAHEIWLSWQEYQLKGVI